MTAATPASDDISAAIAPHLPYLRRFARALTGSQRAGDAFAVAALEALVADRSIYDPSLNARTALFKIFYDIWSTAGGAIEGASGGAKPSAAESAVQERLAALTPRSRQALLLSALEGFDRSEGAKVMGVSEDEFALLHRDAVAAMKSDAPARVLIIEDEPIIAMDIERIVVDLGHEVIEIADTRASAVAIAAKTAPDLVLADIQLADGSSGIDAVKDILSAADTPVVFITAYPDRLLTGERPEPTFLITKPFRDEVVQAAVSQALFFRKPHSA